MKRSHETPPVAVASMVAVLIAGAGPVGLTLAMDLAWRGIAVTVIEKRARAAPPPPKCNHVSARTMEIFRRLGVAGKLRNAGLPADYPNDVSYRTCFTGRELARIPIPCRRDRYIATVGPDTDWPTPEPPHRINQIFLEPILFDHAAQMPKLSIVSEAELESVDYGEDGARARVRDRKTGQAIAFRLPVSGRLRRRLFPGPQGDRRALRRRSRHPARPIDLHKGARAALGRRAYDLNVQQYCCAGLNFGYYYDRSPIVAYDGGAHPPYSMAGFTPSTVPGCRAPYFWLGEGRSFYDALGPEYTLVRFDRSVGISSLMSAADAKRFPLAMLDVENGGDAPITERLLIVRPDQHVAWRGGETPVDPERLLDRLAGRGG